MRWQSVEELEEEKAMNRLGLGNPPRGKMWEKAKRKSLKQQVGIQNKYGAFQVEETRVDIDGSDEAQLFVCPVEKETKKGKITVDSGAAESVWPEDLLPEIETKPSKGSQSGVNYIAAGGQKMPNMGEKKVNFNTKDGLNSSITFQVTKVKKPLDAVSKITEKGSWVCVGPDEAYIHNIATGKRTAMDLCNGTYSLDVEFFTEPPVFRRQD